jgi:hypothetical protein
MTINIDIKEVPLAPKNPLAFRQRLKAARRLDTGPAPTTAATTRMT